MKNKLSIFLFFTFQFMGSLYAQDYFSLYNLGDFVVQTQNISPVYLPEKTFSFATPLNLNANYAGSFKLEDFVKNGELNPAENIKIDFTDLLDTSKARNNINLDFSTNLFMLGFKTNHGSVTLFSNIKSSTNWQYSKDFLQVAVSGVTSTDLTNDKLLSNLYHEMGIGMTRKFLDDKLAVGIRIKYLNGIIHYSTQKDAVFNLDIDEESAIWNLNSQNATMHTSGFKLNDSEIPSIFTKNTGMGFDFGATYMLNSKWEFEVSINDIGYINWKENVKNYLIHDNTNKEYLGISLDEEIPQDVGSEIETVLNEILGATENTNSFKNRLATNLYLSAKYKLSEKNIFSSIIYNNFVFNRVSPSLAIGYNRILRNLNFGALLSTQDNSNKIRFGTNFAINFGKAQIYGAVDNLFGMFGKVEKTTNANFHFGFNLVFDRRY